jgi:pimeloyl-ACP methyl ester carboxylesterase
MSTYVLVHGPFHGAWCWEKVVPFLLGRPAQRAIFGDLPGHGQDPTPIPEITLQSYIDTVVGWVKRAEEPVILVGHSLGGMVIGEVAEQLPEQVSALVYISGLVPLKGQNAFELIGQNAELRSLLELNEAEGWGFVQRDALPDRYYHDCQPEDVTAALDRLRKEPLSPFFQPAQVTPERFGRLPRYYVSCLEDRAVPLTLQQQVCVRTPMAQVFPMNTGHTPFLSAPAALAEILHSVGPA